MEKIEQVNISREIGIKERKNNVQKNKINKKKKKKKKQKRLEPVWVAPEKSGLVLPTPLAWNNGST